jgi:hypothetical protein
MCPRQMYLLSQNGRSVNDILPRASFYTQNDALS